MDIVTLDGFLTTLVIVLGLVAPECMAQVQLANRVSGNVSDQEAIADLKALSGAQLPESPIPSTHSKIARQRLEAAFDSLL